MDFPLEDSKKTAVRINEKWSLQPQKPKILMAIIDRIAMSKDIDCLLDILQDIKEPLHDMQLLILAVDDLSCFFSIDHSTVSAAMSPAMSDSASSSSSSSSAALGEMKFQFISRIMRQMPLFLADTFLDDYCDEILRIPPPLASSLQSIVMSLQASLNWLRFVVKTKSSELTDRRLHILASFRAEHCLNWIFSCSASNVKLLSYLYMDELSLRQSFWLPWDIHDCGRIIRKVFLHCYGHIATLWSRDDGFKHTGNEKDYCLGDAIIPASGLVRPMPEFGMVLKEEVLVSRLRQPPRLQVCFRPDGPSKFPRPMLKMRLEL